MVEAAATALSKMSPEELEALRKMDAEDMTDDQFEAMCAQMPQMTEEEKEKDLDEWFNHPLNCKEVTPEMMTRPEFAALAEMGHEGSPEEVQANFKHHAITALGKLLLKTSRNQEKDFQESLHCFNEALEQNTGDVE